MKLSYIFEFGKSPKIVDTFKKNCYITLYIPIFWTKFFKIPKTLYIPIHKDFETKTPENTKNFGLRRPETCFRLVCSSFYNLWMLWPQFQSILKLQTHKKSSFQKKNTLVWALYIPIQNQKFRKFSKTLYIPIVIYTHTTLYREVKAPRQFH